jgi:hypothetical protein
MPTTGSSAALAAPVTKVRLFSVMLDAGFIAVSSALRSEK